MCAVHYSYEVVDAEDGHSLGRFPNLAMAAGAMARAGAGCDPVILHDGELVDLDEVADAID